MCTQGNIQYASVCLKAFTLVPSVMVRLKYSIERAWCEPDLPLGLTLCYIGLSATPSCNVSLATTPSCVTSL